MLIASSKACTHHFITGDHTKVRKHYLVLVLTKAVRFKRTKNQIVFFQHQTSYSKQIVSVGCDSRWNITSHNQRTVNVHMQPR